MSSKVNNKKIKISHFKIAFGVIVNFLRSRKRESVWILILGILAALGNGTVPFITGKLFDSILAPENSFAILGLEWPLYLWFLLILLVIQIVIVVIDYQSFILRSIFAFYGRFDYQSRAFAKLLEMPLSFHKKKKIGNITSKITNAGIGVEMIAERVLGGLAPQFLAIFVAIFFLLNINTGLAVIAFLAVVLYVLLASLLVRKSADYQEKLIKGWGTTYGDIHDVIDNTLVVKQSVAEILEQKKINTIFKKNIFPYWLQLDKVWQSLDSTRGLVVVILQGTIFLLSFRLVIEGNMSIGELIAFNSYLAMLFAPFTSLLNMWRTIQNGLLDIAAVEKILSTKTENYLPKNAVAIKEIGGRIEFKNVYFYYEKDKPVLQDISFQVNPGEVVALVGESGVGKSTLIDLLSGYHFPKRGKVLVDHHDIKRIPLKVLRSGIAVVPQEVTLFNDSIKKNILYGRPKATQKNLEEAARQSHSLEFIEKFPKKWRQLVGERGVKLSVGQKQRVAIARAVLREPKILILDEPTSALDAKSEKIIQTSLDKLMAGKTTFIIAHRLSTVRKADKILVFKEGKIIESGSHDQLIQNPEGEYRKLYDLQLGLHE